MNQVRNWGGKCHRCFAMTDEHIMSAYDVSLICMKCWKGEQAARIAVKAKKKKRCWIVVGDVVELRSDPSQAGVVTDIRGGTTTYVDVLWNDGSSSAVPIDGLEVAEEVM